jgi:hypothetical protein
MTPHNLGKITVGVIRLSKLAVLGVFPVAIVATPHKTETRDP